MYRKIMKQRLAKEEQLEHHKRAVLTLRQFNLDDDFENVKERITYL